MSAFFSCILFVAVPFLDELPTKHTRQGVVVSPEGTPVAGADVWVVTGELLRQPIVQKKTDEQGRFQITYEMTDKNWLHAKFIARDGQGRLGWSKAVYHQTGVEPDTSPLRLEIRPTTIAAGSILGPDGKPLRHATIKLQHFNQPPGATQEQLIIPTQLASVYTTTTDEQGQFRMPNVPQDWVACSELSCPALPSIIFFWKTNEPIIVRVPSLTRIEGQGTGVVDPKLLSGLRVRLGVEQRTPGQAVSYIGHSVESTVQADGRFVFEKVLRFPTGSVQLHDGKDYPVQAEKTPITWNPDGVTHAELKFTPMARVTGRVVEKVTGNGIGGVNLVIYIIVEGDGGPSRLIGHRQFTTETDGSFSTYAPPGKLYLNLRGLSDEFLPAELENYDRIAGWPEFQAAPGQTVKMPPLELLRTTTLLGKAVDAAGKPVAEAQVYITVPDRPGWNSLNRYRPVLSDAQGNFTFKGLDPSDFVPIRVRSKDGTSAGAVVVTPGQIKDVLQIVVKPEYATRFQGKVVDQHGKPVPDAQISMLWHSNFVSKKTQYSGSGRFLDKMTADAEGRFVTGPLWPGDEYQFQALAPGHANGTSGKPKGVEGETVELPPIVLQRSGGSVTGKVVDRQGNPVAAEVFCRADGPKPVSTKTDKDGAFRLTGLYDGPVWVFVRPEQMVGHVSNVPSNQSERHVGDVPHKYYPAVVPATTNGPPLAVTLRRQDEPMPSRDQAAETKRVAQRRQVAKRLIDNALNKTGDRPLSFRMHQAWARLESAKALEHLGDTKGYAADRIRLAVAEQVLATDFEEALLLVQPCEPKECFHTLLKLAEKLAATEPVKAKRLAGELISWARRLDMPDRAWSLALAGRLVKRLGSDAAHRQLVEEAAALVEPAGGLARFAYARGVVAAELASFDPDRAERIVAGIGEPNHQKHFRMQMAVALVSTDYDRALKVYDDIQRENLKVSWPSIKVHMAYRLAAKGEIDRALAVADSMTWPAYRLEALGWIAVLTKDRQRAHKIIDQCVGILFEESKRPQDRAWNGRTERVAGGARLVWFAAMVEYPSVDVVLYRALEQRLTPDGTGEWNRVEARVQNDCLLAMLLSTVEPGAARHLLLGVQPQKHVLASGHQIGYRSLLQTWALLDPEQAVKLADEFAKENLQHLPDPHGEIADMLTMPTKRHAVALLQQISPFQFPAEE